MPFELDHIFVAASRDGPEVGAIRAAGFVEGPAHDHPGQGTASRGVFFENAYLELIWLADPIAASTPPIARTGLSRRVDPNDPSSPFGFGLRSTQDPVPTPPFGAWEYAPPYLPEGNAFLMGANSDVLSEPLIFVLPWSRAPSWDVPDHPSGARKITRVSLAPISEHPSGVFSGFLGLGLVASSHGTSTLLELELDEVGQGRECDLRPELPLVLRW
jgi:hypothetical protein